MTGSEPRAFLATEAVKRLGPHNARPSCLVCGARVGRGGRTIKIGGALVHMRSAVYRRRVARR